MKIKDMNWMEVEDYVKRDDRCVVPIGSTEQHAQLSLLVDVPVGVGCAELRPVR